MIIQTRNRQRGPRMWLTIPFIYGMSVPIAFLDVSTRIYQGVCFPIFGIPKVDRKKFFRFDRGHLSYLGQLDHFNCNYCSYANGVMGFAKEVIAKTEYYWCPIKNKIGGDYKVPEHHKNFAAYNDKATLEDIVNAAP